MTRAMTRAMTQAMTMFLTLTHAMTHAVTLNKTRAHAAVDARPNPKPVTVYYILQVKSLQVQ